MYRLRFEVSEGGSEWNVWDHTDEKWMSEAVMSEETANKLADELNENACAICGKQCDEAHGQTRYGRVCESCCDEFVDDSGEVDWNKVRT